MVDKEKLGYHKGALESLVNERKELNRLTQIVNSLISRHGKALEDMGVDVEEFLENLQKAQRERMETVRNKEGERYDLTKEELPE